ncbi:MAG TPA: membrane protein insertion efficiency factor YidD, partial [Alphaproteobacteria bacterium]|nr:membrane protein insertion efficiency factor YidD [Alphaproteobacteria bacterium]
MVNRVITALLIGLLRVYKVTFSPLFTGTCRFTPSCSTYAAEAVSCHGP